MLKHISNSASRYLILIFFLGLFTRLWFIHEKENLYGDELTSFSLAYNQPGWGDNVYELHKVYTSQDLRTLLFTDDRGGWEGFCDDISALWHNNRDGSHASLYYMALRCVSIGMPPTMSHAIWRVGAFNLLFYALTFYTLFLILCKLHPKDNRTHHQTLLFLMFIYSICPVSISNSVLAREYAMAEAFFTLWTLWSINVCQRLERHEEALSPSSLFTGCLLSALLLSVGYFNALYLLFTGFFLAFRFVQERRQREWWKFLILGCGCIVLCLTFYKGFFHFLHDDRLADVSRNTKGTDFLANFRTSLFALFYFAGKYILTPFVAIGLSFAAHWRWKHRKERTLTAMPRDFRWIAVCAALWFLIVLYVSPWKFTRYISACLPTLLIIVAWQFRHIPLRRRWTIAMLAAYMVYVWTGYPIENLERTRSFHWNCSSSPRILRYAPNNEENVNAKHAIPFLTDQQEEVLIASPDEILMYGRPDSVGIIRVYGPRSCSELMHYPGLVNHYEADNWDDCYEYRLRK